MRIHTRSRILNPNMMRRLPSLPTVFLFHLSQNCSRAGSLPDFIFCFNLLPSTVLCFMTILFTTLKHNFSSLMLYALKRDSKP